MPELIYICILFFVAAALYSSVGHAGASAYLAIMSLFSMAQSTMKPAALILNVMVATITSIRFAKASLVDWRLLLPFAVGSVPLAYLGGMLLLKPLETSNRPLSKLSPAQSGHAQMQEIAIQKRSINR